MYFIVNGSLLLSCIVYVMTKCLKLHINRKGPFLAYVGSYEKKYLQIYCRKKSRILCALTLPVFFLALLN